MPVFVLVLALTALGASRLTNLQHLPARFRVGRPDDPETRLSIVKDRGTTGYLYRSDKVHQDPQSWLNFWELAEKSSGYVTVLGSPGAE